MRPHDEADEYLIKLASRLNLEAHSKKAGNVSEALYALLTRVINTHLSIHILRGYTSTDVFVVDAAVLLRCMFDAYFQAEYIYKDEDKREERAKLYVEYYHVERYNLANKFIKHNNEFSKMMNASPILEFERSNPRQVVFSYTLCVSRQRWTQTNMTLL